MKYNNNNNNNSTSSLGNDGKKPTFTLYTSTSIDNNFDKVNDKKKAKKKNKKCNCVFYYLTIKFAIFQNFCLRL